MDFVTVCTVEELPYGHKKRVEVDGRGVVIAYVYDQYWAFEDRFLTLDSGLRLHYVEATRGGGNGGGRTLLALHGMGSYGGAWRAVLRNLPSVERAMFAHCDSA